MSAHVLGGGRISREVLALLANIPGRELHTRDIARRVGADAHPVQRALEQLVSADLVQSRRLGNLRLWSIRPESPLLPAARELLRQTSGAAEQLRKALAKMRGVHAAFLFGSYASGNDDLHSDIDLFIVGDADWKALSAVATRLASDLGREINSVVWTIEEFADPEPSQRRFLAKVLSGPRIWLLGDDDELERIRLAVGAPMGAHADADSIKRRRVRVAPAARRDKRATGKAGGRGRRS
ncbi:MAG: hypothetical protein AUH85_03550 [Chloroflexi bacterium 13_1_40CM_4_68_4]|nr:MAG: hypothetical protein AUH85_03550 [Chloroflexi bacterium 13_1_40CM_4_68_4]